MKLLYILIMSMLTFQSYAAEIDSAEAIVDKNKKVTHKATEAIDGDLDSVWTKTCDYKVELVIHLEESVKMKSIAIIWGEASPQDLEVKFKTKGRKKKSGPRYKTKEGLSPDVFDLTDLNVSSKQVHIFMMPKENNKVISIKEIKINNGEEVFTPVNQPVETKDETSKDQQGSKIEEVEEGLDDDSGKQEHSPEKPKKFTPQRDRKVEPKLPEKDSSDEYETDF